MKMDGFMPSIFVIYHLIQSKKDSSLRKTVFLGEGIFTMGLVKTYIMYWGVLRFI